MERVKRVRRDPPTISIDIAKFHPVNFGCNNLFEIERVIFNEPATIIIWKDKTKTVVKCHDGDEFNKEAGIALCFMKKCLGNNNTFNKVMHKIID